MNSYAFKDRRLEHLYKVYLAFRRHLLILALSRWQKKEKLEAAWGFVFKLQILSKVTNRQSCADAKGSQQQKRVHRLELANKVASLSAIESNHMLSKISLVDF